MDKELPVSVWPEWKIIEKIGEGSFGKVYKARRIEHEKTFYSAIKVISIPGSQSELKSVQSESGSVQGTREYFKNLMEECIQEVSTMEYFRGNSHIVAVEDYKVVEYLDAIGWDLFIRMEYLTSFLEYCSGKQLTEDEVIRLGIDLCKALQYCQMLNIIHRDIKPENIFVSRFGEFKLGDFGIARELERSMGSFSKKGTYSYMAPEMYRGESYDGRVDIYSLGIMMYKLRNRNRLPFLSLEKQLITYRDKEVALNRRMSGEQLPGPAEAGAGLADIILKACAFDREKRFATAEEFRTALEDLRYERRSERTGEKRSQKSASVIKEAGKTQSSEAGRSFADEQKPESPVKISKTAPSGQEQRSGLQNSKLQEQRQVRYRQPESAGNDGRREQRAAVSPERNVQKTSFRRAEPQREEKNAGNVRRNQRQTDRDRRRTGVQERKKKKESGTVPLLIGIVIMSAAVIAVSVVFVRLLTGRASQPDTGYQQEWMDESEDAGLTRYLADVRSQATAIEDNLNNYNWIGSENDGMITYLDQEGKVMKILICPDVSRDGYYEEYFYWDEKLFFVYVWDSDQEDINYYYYRDGELQRWIDKSNVCHDFDRENEEFVKREEKYLENSDEYTKGLMAAATAE